MENKRSPIPPCPYCESDTGECEHVVLDYDYSFGEYKYGYLARDESEIDYLKEEMVNLIKQGIVPEHNDPFLDLESLWYSAVETFNEVDGEFELDIAAYIKNLYTSSDFYDGIGFKYEMDEEDDYPGFSSEYVIIYSENPLETIRKYNRAILSALRPIPK